MSSPLLYIARNYTPECLAVLPQALSQAAEVTTQEFSTPVYPMDVSTEPPVRVLRVRALAHLVGVNNVDICTIQEALDDDSNEVVSGAFTASRIYRLEGSRFESDQDVLASAKELNIDTSFSAKISLILSVSGSIPPELAEILKKHHSMPHAKDPKRRVATDLAWMAPTEPLSKNRQTKIAESFRHNLGISLAGSLAVGPAYFERLTI